MQEPSINRDLTYGEKAVGLTFNPSNNPVVDAIKQEYAHIIDTMDDLVEGGKTTEMQTLSTEAIRQAQTAQMWAVKAITYQF